MGGRCCRWKTWLTTHCTWWGWEAIGCGHWDLTYCIIYLDDVIVFRHTEEEHLECLRVVFEHFREFNLKLKPSKCNLFQSEIIYLAHHISKEGMRPSKDNVCMIEEFPMPEAFTQVRAFCRLAGHYR